MLLTKIKKTIYHPIKNLIANNYLFFLRKFTNIKVIAITGSAGKTTTKEMVTSILKQVAPTVWTKDNIDPVYNIPATILRCTPWTKYLILEMSVEYPGEMDFYLWLAKPDIGVITNIFPTHTEFFGDADGVLKEKSKLVKYLSEKNFAVLNSKDFRLKNLSKTIRAKVIWFNGENEDAARVVANVLGVDRSKIEKGLSTYQRPKHRYEILGHPSGAVIFDDSYNSNPEALLTTLRIFNKLAGNNIKVVVIGDMLELGKLEISEHKRVGNQIKKYGYKDVIGVGKLVKYITSNIVENVDEAIPLIKKYLQPKTYILIKGSRSIGLDKLVDRLY